MTKSELISRLTLPEALRLFSEYHFSPALEEDFHRLKEAMIR